MKKFTLFTSLFLITAISFAQNNGKIVLNKGQKIVVETTGNALVTQEMMGQQMEIKTNVSSSNTIEVKDVKDTSYSLTNTVTKLKLNSSAMGQDINYDSEKKEDQNSEIGQSMSKVINSPKNIDINRSGKVVNQPKGKTEDDNSNAMLGMIGGSDDGSGGMSVAFQPVPSNITIGSTWMDSSNNEGTINHTTYTVKDLKGNDALISMKGTIQVVNKKVQAQGMEITTNSTGTVTGESLVDAKTGIVKQRSSTVETKGNVEVMGQQVPVTTKITSTVSIK